MTTRISQWQRIAMLAAGIATSMVSVAWGQDLYQTHTDGSIWKYTGVPCSRGVCSGWVELDNNPNLSMIAATGSQLYELHTDGSVWQYTGTPCSGGSCPGWVELGNSAIVYQISVAGSVLYEMDSNDNLWQYTGPPCSGGSCPGWVYIGNAYSAICCMAVGANAVSLFEWQAENSETLYYSSIWQYIGPELGPPGYGWVEIFQSGNTAASMTMQIAVGVNNLYQLYFDGSIWEYYVPSQSWTEIGRPVTAGQPTVLSIAAGGSLYQRRNNSSIWQYDGTTCTGSACWVKIDENPNSRLLAAGSNTVYQTRSSKTGASIWQYTGTPCGKGACSGWRPLDNNPNTKSIVAGPATF